MHKKRKKLIIHSVGFHSLRRCERSEAIQERSDLVKQTDTTQLSYFSYHTKVHFILIWTFISKIRM